MGEILRPRIVERKFTEYQDEDKLRRLADTIKKAKEEGNLELDVGRGKRGKDSDAAVDGAVADDQTTGKVVDSAFLRVLRAMASSQSVRFEIPFYVDCRGNQQSGRSSKPVAASRAVKDLLSSLLSENRHILQLVSKQTDLLATADYMSQAKARVQLLPRGMPMPEGVLANQFVPSSEVALREAVGHEIALQ